MREILFRGKSKDTGKWICGNYMYNLRHNTHVILFHECACQNGTKPLPTDYSLCDCDVDPETVCQYTGLKDKNGRKIFEGDIVKVRFEEARIGAKEDFYNYIVKCDERRAEFGLSGNEELYGRPVFEEHNQPIMEVIGNIFDNPELCE